MTVLKSLSNIQKSGNMTLLFPQRVTLQDRNNLRAHQSHEVQCMLTYDTRILRKTHVLVSDTVSDTRTPRILSDTYPESIGNLCDF